MPTRISVRARACVPITTLVTLRVPKHHSDLPWALGDMARLAVLASWAVALPNTITSEEATRWMRSYSRLGGALGNSVARTVGSRPATHASASRLVKMMLFMRFVLETEKGPDLAPPRKGPARASLE